MPRHTLEERKKRREEARKQSLVETDKEKVKRFKLAEAKRRGITKEAEQLGRDPVKLLQAKESGQAYIQSRERLRAKGLSKREAGRALIGEEERKLLERQQIQEEEQELIERQELLKGITEATTPTPEDIRLDYRQAIGAGVTGIVPGALSGAAIGGAGGAVAAGPPGAFVGAVGLGIAGGVGTFTTLFIANLRTQQSDFVGREVFNIREGEKNLRIVIQNTNLGADPTDQIIAFNDVLMRIDQARSNAKQEAREGSKFLGVDGTKELERFEIFYAVTRGNIVTQFDQAMINPNPNKITIQSEEIQSEE
jgi:outer membrane lipoprotein SlyB